MSKGLKNWIVQKLNINRESASHKMFRIIITFILINFTCIFFRASNVLQALDMIKSIVTQFNPWIFFDDSLYSLGLDRK